MIDFAGVYNFSTFMLETSNLIRDGETMRAFMNVFLSVMLVSLYLGSVYYLANCYNLKIKELE